MQRPACSDVAAAKRANCVIELAPRVGDFVAVDEPLFLLRGGDTTIDDCMLRGQVACINSAARSSRQLKRFYVSINADKVFGTHRGKNVDSEICCPGESKNKRPRYAKASLERGRQGYRVGDDKMRPLSPVSSTI